MVFNATFNNSSIVSGQSVLLVEETRKKNSDRPQVTDKLDYIIYVYSNTDQYVNKLLLWLCGCMYPLFYVTIL
jgi:formylmethanofuran dehydrogenase subunit B